MSLGIRGRLLMLAVGIAVPLAVVGAIDLRGMWNVSRAQLDDSVKQQAELAAIAFERWVDAQRQPLVTIAAAAAQQKLDDSSFINLRYIVETRPHWIDLRIVDAEGKSLLVQPADQSPLPSALIKYLLTETDSRKSWVLVTDRTRDEARPVFAIAVPIEGQRGVVIARIDGSAISELFGETKFPDQAVIAVFGSQGRLLYRQQSAEKTVDMEVSGSPLFAALGDRRLAVIEVESPYDEIRRVYGLARAGATDFVVVVGVPSARLYEPARQQFVRYLFFSLLALACAVIAALFIERGITRPIRRLSGAAQSLGAGNLATRAPLSESGEIGELSAAFNTMAAQIAEREERLTELDQLKSEFVSSVSHELRTPLTTIKTLIHVLLRGQIGEAERREYLETIAAECDRQIDLVLNLLDLSRIESGAYKVSLGRVNPAEVVVACVTSAHHAAEARRQNLQANIPADLPSVLSDKGALRRVLCSLVENAIKYTPEAGSVTVGARVAGNEVALYVRDTGCGIMAEDLPRIFEKFYRGRPASAIESTAASEGSREYAEQPGVGLGLYLVRSILDQLGGRVMVESGDGRGTTFTLYLPVWREEMQGRAREEMKDVEAFARS
ncbi:MAG: ATP-binding protein [Pyrinomonadaceae bacterium]